jgi:hypothetical protein
MKLHSCREAARLLSQAMDEPLSRLDRLQLRLHLFVCLSCRHVDHQARELRAMTGKLLKEGFDFDALPGEGKSAKDGAG